MSADPTRQEGICDRCDVQMERQPMYPGSESECWYCPCCRSRLRTIPMLQADWDRHAAEMGLTREQYETHMEKQVEKFIGTPSGRDLARAKAFAAKSEAEWHPVCEHEPENPWR